MTVWVRYTGSTPLERLRSEISTEVSAERLCHSDVVDDDIADLAFDVESEAEGVDVVAVLRQRLANEDGLEIVRATFFQKGPAR